MPGELQYVNLTDFTGGLNMYRNQFQLADNESPQLLNVDLDPRAGFFSRAGITRMNGADIQDPGLWDPRSARTVILSGDESASYIASEGKIFTSPGSGTNWTEMVGAACGANPHLADYASWGNKAYIVCGPAPGTPSIYQEGNYIDAVNEFVPLLNPTVVGDTFDDDYTIPTSGAMPVAEVCEPHAGYMFVANLYDDIAFDGTDDGGGLLNRPNRLRWSHPLNPEAWARNDYIDIETGGGEITALMSFQDHLLIFKTDSMWALYGYETDSFQLIKVSRDIGVRHPGAVTRSETAIFFHSSSDRGDIWAYDGTSPSALSAPLRPVMDEITEPDDVWVTWVARQLIISVPWNDDPLDATDRSVFTWDPDVGRGAWSRFAPATDEVRCFLERGDHVAEGRPVFIMAGSEDLGALGVGTAGVCKLEGTPLSLDYIRDGDSEGQPFTVTYKTGWKDAASPERRKSWRRPRFVLPSPTITTKILVSTWQDYEEGVIQRQHYLEVDNAGSTLWTATGLPDVNGIHWTATGPGDPNIQDGAPEADPPYDPPPEADGGLWDKGTSQGDQIRRNQPVGPGLSGLGVCAAVQLEFKISKENSNGSRWGLDAAILKHRSRRGTT